MQAPFFEAEKHAKHRIEARTLCIAILIRVLLEKIEAPTEDGKKRATINWVYLVRELNIQDSVRQRDSLSGCRTISLFKRDFVGYRMTKLRLFLADP